MEIPTPVRELDEMIRHDNVDRINPDKVIKVLNDLASCNKLVPAWRAEARKAGALLRNIMRTKNGVSRFEILLILSATPLGVEINQRIIFYATQKHLHTHLTMTRPQRPTRSQNQGGLLSAYEATQKRN